MSVIAKPHDSWVQIYDEVNKRFFGSFYMDLTQLMLDIDLVLAIFEEIGFYVEEDLSERFIRSGAFYYLLSKSISVFCLIESL